MSFGSKSLPPPTGAELERIRLAKDGGCVACTIEGRTAADGWCGTVEFNHIHRGVRSGHRYGYALGAWHHRGVPREGLNERDMEAMYGPSLARGSRPFRARYGSDQALQDFQDRQLGLPTLTIPTKRRKGSTDTPSNIFPRHGRF